jgi:hypothetical protein
MVLRSEQMRATAEYIQRAIDCRILAGRMTRPEDKTMFEELAEAWEKIVLLSSPPPILLGLTLDRWRFRIFDLYPMR